MKKIEVIVSEGGTPLMNPDDGFIVYGSIMKADGQGGLFGDGRSIEVLDASGLNARAYTNFEFFDALCLAPEVFYQYYLKNKKPGMRQDGAISRGALRENSTFGTDEFGVYRDLGT